MPGAVVPKFPAKGEFSAKLGRELFRRYPLTALALRRVHEFRARLSRGMASARDGPTLRPLGSLWPLGSNGPQGEPSGPDLMAQGLTATNWPLGSLGPHTTP